MKPTVAQATISLHKAYHGGSISVKINKTKICLECSGKGGEKVDTCTQCKGHGVVVKMVQLGPGMYSQSQAHCDKCEGKGKVIEKSSMCKTCMGKGIKKETENVDVTIEPGFPNKEKVVI